MKTKLRAFFTITFVSIALYILVQVYMEISDNRLNFIFFPITHINYEISFEMPSKTLSSWRKL